MSAPLQSKAEPLQVSDDLLRLRELLDSSSKLDESESKILELVNFLDTISDVAISDPDNQIAKDNAFQVLSEMYQFISSPSLDQEVVDALSYELPKTVSKFAGISSESVDMAMNIVDEFVVKCSPRDMLPILSDALGTSSNMKVPGYVAPLLSALPKVFLSLKRRQFEQVKTAVPVILNALKALCLRSDVLESMSLLDKAVGIASSMQEVCKKLEGDANEKLRVLLGLYVLQCMALLSFSSNYKASNFHHVLLQLSHFLSYCDLTYLTLLTDYDVDIITSTVFGDDKDDYISSFLYVKHGCALSVIWGHISEEVVQSAKENMTVVKDELQSNQIRRWQALGTLKHVLSCLNLPWELKKHTLDFLFCVTNTNVPREHNESSEWSTYMPNIFSTLQAVKMLIMYAPDRVSRKSAFDTFKSVIADVPASHRLEVFKALIVNTDSSSMIAILMDLVKGEMLVEICNRKFAGDGVPQKPVEVSSNMPFWIPPILELVELVLRPPQGGPPSLPEQGDMVLSALNLYRYIIMTESAGNTNYTGVLSKNVLQKAYNEWLLPLRILLQGMMSENRDDYDQLSIDIMCTLNPIELVLYRCIELVEEKLNQI